MKVTIKYTKPNGDAVEKVFSDVYECAEKTDELFDFMDQLMVRGVRFSVEPEESLIGK